MGEFNFNNLNLSSLRAGMRIDKDNIFLKKYDKDGNSIFDADELYTLVDDLENFAGDDKKLNKTEALSLFSNVMNISLDKAKEIFNQKGNIVVDSFNTLVEQDAKADAVDFINDDVNTALNIYENAKGGAVSRFYNSVKQFFNTEYAGDKVYRQLARNKVSAMMLEKCNNNYLSVREYAEMKIDFLEALLGGDNLSDSDKELIRKSAKLMNLKNLDTLIEKLVNVEDSGYANLKKETLKNLKQAEHSNNSEIGFAVQNPNSIGAIIQSQGESKLSFDTIFKYENDVEFDTDKIQDYETKQLEFSYIAGLYNRIAHQYNDLDKAIEENKPESLKEIVNSTLNSLFGNDNNAKSEFIRNLGFNPLYNLSDSELLTVAKNLKGELLNQRERLLSGKTIDEHIVELGKAKYEAFGEKHNIDLAEKFAESQANGVASAKLVASGVGIIATLAGGPMVLVGMALSVAGSAGVSFVEEASKPGDISADKSKEILEELTYSGIMNTASMGSGLAASVIGKIIATRCPKLIAAIAEYGSDAVMSLITDVALTGDFNLKGEGFAQLINVITGLGKRNVSTTARMEHNNPARISTPGRTVDDVMPLVERMCKKYNMNMEVIVNHYLKGLNTELAIFKNEETLKDYIDTVYKLTNARNSKGELAFSRNVFHFVNQRIEKNVDYKLIQDIALLKATSPKCKEQLERLCYLVEIGKISPHQLKKTIIYFKEGYISPSTIDIALSSRQGLKVTDLIEDVKPLKYVKKDRKKVIETLEKMSPEIKDAIKALKKDIGKDIYKIKWENLAYQNLDTEDYLAFIFDIKNIKYLKNIETEIQNFFIKLPGYGTNSKWANDMVQITESASHMLREGATFDEVMAYIAVSSRDLALRGVYKSKDNDKVKALGFANGILRGGKVGYLCNRNVENRTAITAFDVSAEQYHSYANKFRKRFSPNELKNPYAGRIELTRLVPDGKYPIEEVYYDPRNPNHVREVNPDGSVSYYEVVEAMIHPKGKYGVEGLNIAEELHNKLLDKFQNRTITPKDLDEINETVAEIHWVIAHTMPWGRGSDAIANSYVKAVYQSLGIKTYPPKDGISFDLEAFCTELDDYKKLYKNLYEKEPDIMK